jgi:hypothetical protein
VISKLLTVTKCDPVPERVAASPYEDRGTLSRIPRADPATPSLAIFQVASSSRFACLAGIARSCLARLPGIVAERLQLLIDIPRIREAWLPESGNVGILFESVSAGNSQSPEPHRVGFDPAGGVPRLARRHPEALRGLIPALNHGDET